MGVSYSYDLFGKCFKCFTPIIQIDGYHPTLQNPITLSLLPIYRSVEFKLDDGSKTHIGLCIGCAEKLTPQDCQTISESMVKAWQQETNMYVELCVNHPEKAKEVGISLDWTRAKADQYMSVYSQRYIVDAPAQSWSVEQINEVVNDHEKNKKPKKDKDSK